MRQRKFASFVLGPENIRAGMGHTLEVREERWKGDFLITISPLQGKNGEISGWIHVAHDITKRKQTEMALRESEERYRTLFENSRDAFYITHRSGELIDANQATFDLFGYTREEMIVLDVLMMY